MKNNVIKKIIKGAVMNAASKNANRICTFFFYQPKLPDAVKKLRKF